MNDNAQTLEGYVVDIACIRKFPQDELLERARAHTRECLLMDHCIESGYGLIDENGVPALLDESATEKVVETVRSGDRETEIRLRAVRERDGKEMKTTQIKAI